MFALMDLPMYRSFRKIYMNNCVVVFIIKGKGSRTGIYESVNGSADAASAYIYISPDSTQGR